MKKLFPMTVVVTLIFQRRMAAGLETFCDNNIFVRLNHRGVVSCDFGDVDVVAWIKRNPTQTLEKTLPFISLENSEIHQPESGNGEYSILPNGSLVIKNVTYSNERNYTARVVKNGAVVHLEVQVKVYVIPVPDHPVVDGRVDQQRVIIRTSSRKASFSCTINNIRPVVPLEAAVLPPISDYISVTTVPSILSNPDGTYNISLDTQLKIGTNLPIDMYPIQCRVAKSFAHLFPSVTAIDLLVLGGQRSGQIKFPAVNGLDSQQHVDLNVDREGTLTCSMDSVSPNVHLGWKYLNNDSSTIVALGRPKYDVHDNRDGTYNIMSKNNYTAIGDLIQYVIIKCELSGEAAYLYPLYVTVGLHFPAAESKNSKNTCQSKQSLPMTVAAAAPTFLLLVVFGFAMYQTYKRKQMSKTLRALQGRDNLLRPTVNSANGDGVATVV